MDDPNDQNQTPQDDQTPGAPGASSDTPTEETPAEGTGEGQAEEQLPPPPPATEAPDQSGGDAPAA